MKKSNVLKWKMNKNSQNMRDINFDSTACKMHAGNKCQFFEKYGVSAFSR